MPTKNIDILNFNFWDITEKTPEIERFCDHPSCKNEGTHPAPKSREDLRDYHYFCHDHIQEYNKSWNYFDGYDEKDIEAHIRKDMLWGRPTWKAHVSPLFEKKLRQKVYEHFKDQKIKFKFHGYDFEEWEKSEKKENFEAKHNIPEMEALEVFGLTPPVEINAIKKKYKLLVKLYHPDTNRNDAQAEERIKKINAAYATLKKAYTRYERIKDI